jgi:two-component system OmpR family response regulator
MSQKTQVLIVDDDNEITSLLQEYLARFRYAVHTACDGVSMRKLLALNSVDLVVMDVMLPGEDGMALAREVRQSSLIPIIMLSARSDPFDRVVGLENGADDYVSKPFEPRELVARIQTVLRRSKTFNDSPTDPTLCDIVCFDGWKLHRDQRNLHSPDGMVVPLSNAEFRLLHTFLQTPGRTLSREQLIEQARGREVDSFDRSIDLLVSRLRQKLAHVDSPDSIIKTVRGAGYMFNVHSVQGRMTWRI